MLPFLGVQMRNYTTFRRRNIFTRLPDRETPGRAAPERLTGEQVFRRNVSPFCQMVLLVAGGFPGQDYHGGVVVQAPLVVVHDGVDEAADEFGVGLSSGEVSADECL